MTLQEIAQEIRDSRENIHLIYAFNGTGKTRLSTAYKDVARNPETHRQTGVYFNAYSEDLFVWDNDIEHSEGKIRLNIVKSSLNELHSFIDEAKVYEKLKPYKPTFDFEFHSYEDNPENGFEYITFHVKDDKEKRLIKISKGEERVFVWCFFLALFEAEGWHNGKHSYFFIDDPVSSLDDNNIFITVFSLFNLIEKNYEDRKIIITTHHIGFASIISDYLSKGEKADKYKGKHNQKKYKIHILERNGDCYSLVNPKNEVLLYHLRIMQVLEEAISNDSLEMYHLAMLRQLLENVSSFLGSGQFSYVLQLIGFNDTEQIATIVNALTHQRVYYPQSNAMVEDNKKLVREVFTKLMNTFKFIIHEKA